MLRPQIGLNLWRLCSKWFNVTWQTVGLKLIGKMEIRIERDQISKLSYRKNYEILYGHKTATKTTNQLNKQTQEEYAVLVPL